MRKRICTYFGGFSREIKMEVIHCDNFGISYFLQIARIILEFLQLVKIRISDLLFLY